MSDPLKVIMALGDFARVDQLAASEEDELVKHGDDVAPRLMDREDDCAVVVPRE